MKAKGYFIKKYEMALRPKLALIKARWYDRLSGIDTAAEEGPDDSKLTEDGSLGKDRHPYQPTFYGRLEKMLAYLKLTQDDVFVDLGCGKGRAVFFVARQKIKKVIGVELNPKLFAVAQKNLKNFRRGRSPIKLLNVDAACFNPQEGTAFFLFNPFGRDTLEAVLGNIENSLVINPRGIRIVYYGAEFRQLLDDQGWLKLDGFVEDQCCLVWRSS